MAPNRSATIVATVTNMAVIAIFVASASQNTISADMESVGNERQWRFRKTGSFKTNCGARYRHVGESYFRTCLYVRVMSALPLKVYNQQLERHASLGPKADIYLFDHIVGAGE